MKKCPNVTSLHYMIQCEMSLLVHSLVPVMTSVGSWCTAVHYTVVWCLSHWFNLVKVLFCVSLTGDGGCISSCS